MEDKTIYDNVCLYRYDRSLCLLGHRILPVRGCIVGLLLVSSLEVQTTSMREFMAVFISQKFLLLFR